MPIASFDPDALCRSGRLLLEQGDTGRARPFFDKALELDPDHLEALMLRAAARLQEFDSEPALADLSRALELAPNHLDSLLVRGRAALSLGRRLQAATDFSRALDLAPHEPEIWQLRGQAREGGGHYRAASSDYRQALALGHEQPTLLAERLGYCHLALGEFEVCEEFMCQARLAKREEKAVIAALPGPTSPNGGAEPPRRVLFATNDPPFNHRLAGFIRRILAVGDVCRFTTCRSAAGLIDSLCRTRHALVCCGIDRLEPGGSGGPELRLQLVHYIRERHPKTALLCLVPPMYGTSYRRQLLDAGAHRVMSSSDPDQRLQAALGELINLPPR